MGTEFAYLADIDSLVTMTDEQAAELRAGCRQTMTECNHGICTVAELLGVAPEGEIDDGTRANATFLIGFLGRLSQQLLELEETAGRGARRALAKARRNSCSGPRLAVTG